MGGAFMGIYKNYLSIGALAIVLVACNQRVKTASSTQTVGNAPDKQALMPFEDTSPRLQPLVILHIAKARSNFAIHYAAFADVDNQVKC